MAVDPSGFTRASLVPATIDSLPLDVLTCIFKYFTTRPKLLCLARVCKRWRLAVPASVDTLVIDIKKKKYRVEANMAHLLQLYRHVTDLTLAVSSVRSVSIPTSVKRLQVYYGSLAPPYPTRLTHLSVYVYNTELPAFCPALTEFSTSLTSLSITVKDAYGGDWQKCAAEIKKMKFPAVRRLHLWLSHDETMEALIRNSRSLAELEVSNGPWLSRADKSLLRCLVSARNCGNTYYATAPHCPKLKFWSPAQPLASFIIKDKGSSVDFEEKLLSEIIFDHFAMASDLVWRSIPLMRNLKRIWCRHPLSVKSPSLDVRMPYLEKFSLHRVSFLESLIVARYVLHIAPSLRKLQLFTLDSDQGHDDTLRLLLKLIEECRVAGVSHLVAVIGKQSADFKELDAYPWMKVSTRVSPKPQAPLTNYWCAAHRDSSLALPSFSTLQYRCANAPHRTTPMSSGLDAKFEDVLKLVAELQDQHTQMAQQLKGVCAEVACLKNDLAALRSSSPASSGEPAAKQPRIDPPTSSQRPKLPAAAGGAMALHVIPNYSDKAMVVYGKEACFALKDRVFKPMNFKFNHSLRCGAGWIVPRSKISVEKLKELVKNDIEGHKITIVVDQDSASAPAAVGDKRKSTDDVNSGEDA